MYVCMSTFSNIFSSETIGYIEAKFHVEPPWAGNGLGLITNIAAMPIYGKTLKKSPEPKGR